MHGWREREEEFEIFYSEQTTLEADNSIRWLEQEPRLCAPIVHSTCFEWEKFWRCAIILYNQNLWFVRITLRILFGYRYRHTATASAAVANTTGYSLWLCKYNLCEFALYIKRDLFRFSHTTEYSNNNKTIPHQQIYNLLQCFVFIPFCRNKTDYP